MSHKNYRRKERKRKEYTGSKQFDHSCRNHGSCGWCKSNRTIERNEPKTHEELSDYYINFIDYNG